MTLILNPETDEILFAQAPPVAANAHVAAQSPFQPQGVIASWLQTAHASLGPRLNDVRHRLDNRLAVEGVDRCDCGCKYWENDRCTDCGTHVTRIVREYEEANGL